MAKFSLWFETAMGWEGGYSNLIRDKGGETYQGITRKNFPSWPGWVYVDQAKRNNGGTLPQGYIIKNSVLDQEVRKFAKSQFWDFYQADQINSQEIATIIVDFGWASGLVTAAKIVQGLVAVNQDGDFGDKTLKAINRMNPSVLFKKIQNYRLEYIELIVKKDPSQAVFYNGWKNRILDFDAPNRRYRGLKIGVGVLLSLGIGTVAYNYMNN